MDYNIDFSNKQILIDGGAKGIGFECAQLLSQLGAKIILVDLIEHDLKEAISLLSGSNHAYYAFDLSKTEDISSLIKQIIMDNGPLDGYIHCVGVRCRRPLNLITPKVTSDIMNVNFNSFLEIVKNISRKGCYHEGLSIVGISSISAHLGYKSETVYAATKAAMEAAVRCLAQELAPKHIRLNTVVASQINTHVYKEGGNVSESENAKYYLSRQYLGLGEPREVANIIVFLLSSLSSFISGASVPADGGFLSN